MKDRPATEAIHVWLEQQQYNPTRNERAIEISKMVAGSGCCAETVFVD
jgi:hypothetical protein